MNSAFLVIIIEIDGNLTKVVKELSLENSLIKNTTHKSEEINSLVIRDRKLLSQNGYVAIIIKIDKWSSLLIIFKTLGLHFTR